MELWLNNSQDLGKSPLYRAQHECKVLSQKSHKKRKFAAKDFKHILNIFWDFITQQLQCWCQERQHCNIV